MKETEGWVKIKKYTDEGNPVCGECWANIGRDFCAHCDLASLGPSPTCPIWHGESKSESNITKCGHGTRSDMACRSCQEEISAIEISSYKASSDIRYGNPTCEKCGITYHVLAKHVCAPQKKRNRGV